MFDDRENIDFSELCAYFSARESVVNTSVNSSFCKQSPVATPVVVVVVVTLSSQNVKRRRLRITWIHIALVLDRKRPCDTVTYDAILSFYYLILRADVISFPSRKTDFMSGPTGCSGIKVKVRGGVRPAGYVPRRYYVTRENLIKRYARIKIMLYAFQPLVRGRGRA